MTGPEHYREAERLLGDADRADGIIVMPNPQALAAAQVHATLALAATQVDGTAVMRPADRHEWLKAIDPDYAAEQASEVTR